MHTKEEVYAVLSLPTEEALKKLYPDYFSVPLNEGQCYSWGIGDRYVGMVIQHPSFSECYSFISIEGYNIINAIDKFLSSIDLITRLKSITEDSLTLKSQLEENNYKVNGPKRLVSWALIK